jgi:hypothetical protein
MMASNVDGFEFALKCYGCLVVLEKFVEFVRIAYIQLAEAEEPFVDVD